MVFKVMKMAFLKLSMFEILEKFFSNLFGKRNKTGYCAKLRGKISI